MTSLFSWRGLVLLLPLCLCQLVWAAPVMASPSSQPSSQPTTSPSTQPASQQLSSARSARLWRAGIDPRLPQHWARLGKRQYAGQLHVWVGETPAFQWSHRATKAPVAIGMMTMGIAAIAILKLLEDKKLPSLDVPMSAYVPAWTKVPYRMITLRHILMMQSGLAPVRELALLPKSGLLKAAASARPKFLPGIRFRYDLLSVNLLAQVVKRVSGMHLDQYLQKVLFAPLGIKQVLWDKAEGWPIVSHGLHLLPQDLAKVGVMLMQRGTFAGKSILSKASVSLLLKAQPPASHWRGRYRRALLWWLMPGPWTEVIDEALLRRWNMAKMPEKMLGKLGKLMGRRFPVDPWHPFRARRKFYRALRVTLGPDYRAFWRFIRANRLKRSTSIYGRSHGFFLQGGAGVFMAVVPAKRWVVVRMLRHMPHLPAYGVMGRPMKAIAMAPLRLPQDQSSQQIAITITSKAHKGTLSSQELLQWSRSNKPLVRDLAYWGMGLLKSPPVGWYELFVKRFGAEKVISVKAQILRSVGRLGSARTYRWLLAQAASPTQAEALRIAAAQAIGELAVRLPSLRKRAFGLLSRRWPLVAKRSLATQLTFADKALASFLTPLLATRGQTKYWAAWILVRLPLPTNQLLELCYQMLRGLQWTTRNIARKTLLRMGPDAAPLLPRLKELAAKPIVRWRKQLLLRLIRNIPPAPTPHKATTRPTKTR